MRRSNKRPPPAVTVRSITDSKRAFAPAGQAVGQLQIAARGGVDLHRAVRKFLHGRSQQRQFALLGDVQIFDDRPHRAQFRAREAAERVKRSPILYRSSSRFSAPGTVKGRAAQFGGGGAQIQ